MFTEFMSLNPWEFNWNTLFMATVTSSFMISQHALKKVPVKPSGPKALSDDIESIVSLISSFVNDTSSSNRFRGVYPRTYQSMILIGCLAKCFLNPSPHG